MHAGQEQDLQVLRAATLREKRKPPAHATVPVQLSHARTIKRHQEHMPLNYRPV